jgi:hypothetical protein
LNHRSRQSERVNETLERELEFLMPKGSVFEFLSRRMASAEWSEDLSALKSRFLSLLGVLGG